MIYSTEHGLEGNAFLVQRLNLFHFLDQDLDWLSEPETVKSVVLDSFEQLNLAESATAEISLQVQGQGAVT